MPAVVHNSDSVTQSMPQGIAVLRIRLNIIINKWLKRLVAYLNSAGDAMEVLTASNRQMKTIFSRIGQ